MKENKNIFYSLILIVLLLNISVVYSEEKIEKIGTGITGTVIEQVLGGLTKEIVSIVGGFTSNPWLIGIAGGVYSGINTYKGLSEKVDATIRADRVNISDREQDFLNSSSYKSLVIDPDKEMIITDKNTFDIIYKETIKDLTLYKDTTKNPTLRVAERTDLVSILDTNNTKAEGQKRGLLFEDPNQTIKDAYEYRTLLIKYNLATYKVQPVKITIDKLGDILSKTWYKIFNSGKQDAEKAVFEKILDFSTTDKAQGEIPVEKIQMFKLLFNSRVDSNETIDSSLLDCVSEDGKLIGTTGKEVLPKITLNWDFFEKTQGNPEAINGDRLDRSNWCDYESNGVYCDSTQFTIEILQKINEINNYVKQYSNCFECPKNYVEQELVSEVNNLGIIYLSANISDNLSEVLLNYKIRGNYIVDQELVAKNLFDLEYIIEKKSPNSYNWVTLASGNLKKFNASYLTDGGVNEEDIKIKLSTKPQEDDLIKVKLLLTNFNSVIENYETGNNTIDNSIETEISKGLEACNIEKTSSNLLKYSQSCSKKYDDKLSNFSAYLMKDGYSLDFKKDFDDHYRSAFLQAPDWYSKTVTDYTPLHKYLTEKNNFNFVTQFSTEVSNLVIPNPGLYNIEILITYDNKWRLFNELGDPTGKIEIIINTVREKRPEIDSPIYYMPIDGVVGITGDKTRNGYGVDYLGDTVMIDHVFNQGFSLQTQGFASQNTVNTVDIKEIKDFGIMNTNDTRGKILEIQRLSNKLSLKYIPSRPTSVVMSVTNNEVNTDAYAFYKLSLGLPLGEGGDVAHPGDYLTHWTGFAQCKDFTGSPLLERFLGGKDIISINSQLAPITQNQAFSYGVEWPKNTINRTGTVWLYTIFYTPSNFKTGDSTSYLYRDSVSSSLNFYANNSTNPNPSSIALTNALGKENDIKSIKMMFDLVKEKKACMNYDSSVLEIFYNPKEISKPLTDLIDQKLEENKDKPNSEFSCIRN